MRARTERALQQGVDVGEAVRSFDATPFLRPANAAELNPGNANRTCLEVEQE